MSREAKIFGKLAEDLLEIICLEGSPRQIALAKAAAKNAHDHYTKKDIDTQDQSSPILRLVR